MGWLMMKIQEKRMANKTNKNWVIFIFSHGYLELNFKSQVDSKHNFAFLWPNRTLLYTVALGKKYLDD